MADNQYMRWLEFDKCCFCIELRTGCLIIGYLNLVVNIINIFLSILVLTATSGAIITHDNDYEIQNLGSVMCAVFSVMLVLFVVFLAFTIVLLVGLHQYKRGHVKVYIIYTMVFIVLHIVLWFASFAGKLNRFTSSRDIFSIFLNIYFLLVIRSYYLRMPNYPPYWQPPAPGYWQPPAPPGPPPASWQPPTSAPAILQQQQYTRA